MAFLRSKGEIMMTHSRQHWTRVFVINWGAAPAIVIALALTVALTPAAQAQTFQVIYNFTGGIGGVYPWASMTIDKAGNLYGTTELGGAGGFGMVFKLAPKNSGWIFNPLYSFQGGSDGKSPEAPLTIGPDGSLYGTTVFGGNDNCGIVFNLRPAPTRPASVLTPWRETVLHNLGQSNSDGCNPYAGVTLDQAGNVYGTTAYGGYAGNGIVFELTPAGDRWNESVLHTFAGPGDAAVPFSGLTMDSAGNLYGTTFLGGVKGGGSVYELTPSGSGWTEKVLYSFQYGMDGGDAYAGLILDQEGNLYGAAATAGAHNGGTVYQLMPSNGNWTFKTLYALSGIEGPYSSLVMDAAGNLYGTNVFDGAYGYGSVFKLTPQYGGWTYTDLHDFPAGTDGGYPYGGLVLDGQGNLYGVTPRGGNPNYCFDGCGVIFEVTP
jgi:uncharacterized repeat protein (TIGR03803 family)